MNEEIKVEDEKFNKLCVKIIKQIYDEDDMHLSKKDIKINLCWLDLSEDEVKVLIKHLML